MTIVEYASPIVTERLELRMFVDSDLDDVHAWMSDSDVTRYQLYDPRSHRARER